MELVNENPDSDETMSLTAEDLLDKFNVEGQDGWVLHNSKHVKKIGIYFALRLLNYCTNPSQPYSLLYYGLLILGIVLICIQKVS